MPYRQHRLGCAISLVIWAVAAFVLLGTMMGDCTPVGGHVCPTEADRERQLIKILLFAASLNAALIWLSAIRGRDDR